METGCASGNFAKRRTLLQNRKVKRKFVPFLNVLVRSTYLHRCRAWRQPRSKVFGLIAAYNHNLRSMVKTDLRD